jgi:4-oxalomesaconate tautomerase
MPTVVLRAADMGLAGTETREALDANEDLKARLEAIRLVAGPMMNLGDVARKSVPKTTMVSPPLHGGAIATRTFIPHSCHASIGVLGGVSVATACLLPGSPAAALAVVPEGRRKALSVEHPSGETTVIVDVDASGKVTSAAVLRTARKLFDGVVFGD